MRQYTVSQKKRDLGDKLLVRFTPQAQRALKSLMREFPEQSANAIINAIIEAAGAPTKPVTP